MTSDSYLTGGNRPFYVHFTFEHEGLECAVHDLQRCLRDPKKKIVKEQLSMRLTQLRDLMTKHFHEEEEGCFDEICAQHPHMCPATHKMEMTHRLLLSQLDNLVRDLEAELVSEDWKDSFDAFADEMEKHKEEEQAFVRRGLLQAEEGE
ncbi:hemerythrin domain-containing protein [Bremerella sp. P1]|uniref:hemerythrin domain-containing protein n=1 Tax=Bremerella sp. P1 TaxID=3026424 RepID=UPI002368EE41|nr:hemerythrin domain-containing protein [Bremerella sp. P1]WDI44697.1 hemerythrin domain-containing protein [Bremerella sp. P1]